MKKVHSNKKSTYPVVALLLIMFSCQSVEKDDASNFFLKGNVQFSQKNYEQALHYYDEAVNKNSDFPDAYLNRGLVLLELQRPVDALQSLSQAIDADEQLYPAYLARAEVEARLGQWDEAMNDMMTIQKSYADSSRYYLIHGNIMVGKNDLSAALADFDHALQLEPANTEALVNRGAVYFNQKQYGPAKSDFEAALQIDPKQPEALNNLGLLAARNKQWKVSIDFLDRALSINPVDPLALNNKGFVLLNTNKPDEAVVLINRSIQNQPGNGYALRNLGLYYLMKNNLDKSTETFEQALELAQPVELLHGYAGEAFYKSGNKSKACEIWKTGVVLKDSLADNYHKLNCQ
ncbi:tetratricopeptide repeat protein [Persicitalea jodogahamensis]